jgi:hypothetical protein
MEPVTSGQVDVAAGVADASGEVVERLDIGMAEAHVVASSEVARKLLVTKDSEDRPGRMRYEGHACFDQDVGPLARMSWLHSRGCSPTARSQANRASLACTSWP